MIEFEPGQLVSNGSPAIVVPWMALDELLAGDAGAIGIWD